MRAPAKGQRAPPHLRPAVCGVGIDENRGPERRGLLKRPAVLFAQASVLAADGAELFGGFGAVALLE